MSETTSAPTIEQAVAIGVEAAEAALHPEPAVQAPVAAPVAPVIVAAPDPEPLPAKVRLRWAYSFIDANGSHPRGPAGATVTDSAQIATLVARGAPIAVLS